MVSQRDILLMTAGVGVGGLVSVVVNEVLIDVALDVGVPLDVTLDVNVLLAELPSLRSRNIRCQS